ncbi:MAG: hypothetical protein JWN80_2033 [Microbacteriaceae bacterium]|jgi:hypothetical protein|nr:hypothetical protein [Microbacteriaceae bacterium]
MLKSAASAPIGFLGVDWGSIALVFVVALVAVVVIVSFYSLGLRLLAHGSPGGSENNGALKTTRDQRPLGATVGGFACIAVGVLGVLYGIYLVIPGFH